MKKRRLASTAVLVAAAQLALTAPAHGASAFAALPSAFALLATSAARDCGSAIQPALGPAVLPMAATGPSKASAILGKPLNQLELISLRQKSTGSQDASLGLPPSDGVGGVSAPGCRGLVMPQARPATAFAQAAQSTLDADDFLGSKRLPVRRTTFDKAWNRVRSAGLGRMTASEISRGLSSPSQFALLSAVNAWTNAKVRYVEDSVLYGKADYWANAGSTLRRRAGDCEDIAIVKMQVLAALGIDRSSMYLTIARDLVRNADHALLIVKLDGKSWLLDNATNEPIDARGSNDYRPIMSFSTSQSWLHGYGAPTTARSEPRQTPVGPASASS